MEYNKDRIREILREYNNNVAHQQDQIQFADDIAKCLCCGCHGSAPHLTKTLIMKESKQNE